MYTGANGKTWIDSAEPIESKLRDEVRRLTRFSQEDFIALTSAQLPYDARHLPAVAILAT
jgi:hypothetical protein